MYSLRRRLLISATLILLLFLGVLAVGLNTAFEKSVLTNVEDGLRNQVLLLIANMDVVDGQIHVPEVLSEPRLSQAESSLFAQIYNTDQGVIWRSQSLLGESLPLLTNGLGAFEFSENVDWPNKPQIFSMTLGIEWETDSGDLPFTIQVSEKASIHLKRLSRYQRTVGLWLAVLGGLLLLLLLLTLRWALTPLQKVAKQVGEIEQGQRQRFDEDYPIEVSRLTQNLNQLLNFDEQRINRQKEVLGNLAHSLKTPIAVMSGLSYDEKNRDEAQQQLGAMQNIIDYQLQSASAIGRRRFAKPIDIKVATQKIITSLEKIHIEKGLDAFISISDEVQFYGDEGDWMELAGNLLDNAFKWAKSTVSIEVANQAASDDESHRLATTVIVSDDGSGIDDDLKYTILNRGVRLDSQTPGHGLGLHIVKGIVDAYGGELSIEDKPNGGTVFKASLN